MLKKQEKVLPCGVFCRNHKRSQPVNPVFCHVWLCVFFPTFFFTTDILLDSEQVGQPQRLLCDKLHLRQNPGVYIGIRFPSSCFLLFSWLLQCRFRPYLNTSKVSHIKKKISCSGTCYFHNVYFKKVHLHFKRTIVINAGNGSYLFNAALKRIPQYLVNKKRHGRCF